MPYTSSLILYISSLLFSSLLLLLTTALSAIIVLSSRSLARLISAKGTGLNCAWSRDASPSRGEALLSSPGRVTPSPRLAFSKNRSMSAAVLLVC